MARRTVGAVSRNALDADVAIVGAGPAGTATAVHLGQLGVKNVVLVDSQGFPRDKTCGSGVSPKGIRVLEELGVWPQVRSEAYPINGLRLVTRGGREVFVSGGDSDAAVICLRRTFDNILLERALSLGTRFVPGFHARVLLEENGRVAGLRARDGREVRASYTVIANGTHSRFVATHKPRKLIHAVMGWWEDVPFEPHHVEMVFDELVLPYYGWLFPEGPGRVNIGVCYGDDRVEKNARRLFRAFLDKHYRARLRGARQVGDVKGHAIAPSRGVAGLHSPGRIVVGEAGRMAHPATAEGIYQGMRSGMLAGESLRGVLDGEVDEAAAFASYERRCRRAFSASFAAARLVHATVSSPLPDWIAAAGERPAVRRVTGRLMAQM